MTMRFAGVATLAAVLLPTAAACGTTFIDESVATVDSSPGATTTTMLPVDPDAPLDEILPEIESLLVDLDERIVDDDAAERTLDRVLQLWAVAEPKIRSNDPDDVFNFEQAIELARTGVERLRPADASKSYRIWRNVADAYAA